MKILHVNTFDIKGAIGLAPYNTHQALLHEGLNSQMLVLQKNSDDPTVKSINTRFYKAFINLHQGMEELALKKYPQKSATGFTSSIAPFNGIVKTINSLKPDLVHLNNIHGGTVRLGDLNKIKAPIVWSLHDMWAFTGGCHYDEFCGAYETICGHCKVLRSTKSYDLSRKVFQLKAESYKSVKNIIFVGTSKWLAKAAKDSTLLKGKEIVYLPPPIDTEIFSPIDKMTSRETVSLPKDRKLALFNAREAEINPMKGLNELIKALQKLEKDDLELVVIGSLKPETVQGFQVKVHCLGPIDDAVSSRLIYASADLIVCPALQENTPEFILEGMACGTPVVAFGSGAMDELIIHKESGFLAELNDTDALAKGIEWILNHPDPEKLSVNAIKKVKDDFDKNVVVKKYVNLYNEILALPSIGIKSHIEAIFSGK